MLVGIQFVCLAMELVGAALGHQFHDAGFAVLRVALRSDDLDFLEGHGRLRVRLQFVRPVGRHGLAIHHVVHGPAGDAVHAGIAAARSAVAVRDHAGAEGQDRQDATV